MKQALRLSLIYSVASIFIGPALVFFTAGGHPSGWDCMDSSWDPAVPITVREAMYDRDALPMLIGSYVMLALGIGLLAYLMYQAHKTKQMLAVILPAGHMLFMFLGYLAIIFIASSPWCS